ncbi:protein SREK1IP1-like [Diabrotica virgifera virgifera]|uniref:Uncharacterized protein n=1 Tax=Diabrotica virgifera virgifera TaxID=50390 RepID=A0ABM5KP33_DIAVI|nr:protein SREK1IP1-like [Diabrotica virgifera virgifera]
MEQQIPLNIQEIIQATVDRAIATLLESGLLKEKKGRKHHSRSRSPHKGKKDKKKHKKRSSSSSSCSSASGEDEGKKKKEKKEKRCAERQSSRSHSRGRHSRSRSRSKHHHKMHHHSKSPATHHHFHYSPCWLAENSSEGPCHKSHDGKRKKHSRRLRCMKFYYKQGPATSDENDEQEKDCELTKNFENLEVGDNNPSAPLVTISTE